MADLRFNVSAETRDATAKLGALAQDIQSKLVNAVRSLPDLEITADSTDAQKEVKRIRDEMAALADKKVGIDISAEDALAEMQRLQTELRTLGSTTTEAQVRADTAAAERALGDVEARIREVGGADAEVEVTADTSQAEEKLDGLKVGAAAAGAAAGAVLASGFANAMEFESAQAKLTAQLGDVGPISEQAGRVAGDLYANAYGESLGEVGDAVQLVIKGVEGMGAASDEQLSAVTAKVISLAGTFDQDLGGTVNAVGQMIKTGLASNADEALDILTRGFQEGNDKADDLLDTMNEYGTQFRKVGVDGQTAMGLISQGLQAGARDADLVADAIKEFSIRAIDGSEATADGFKAIGLNAGEMGTKIAAGGDSAKAALDLTLDRLRSMKDPTDQAAAAVALFGTQSEDLGQALFALDPSAAVLENVAGAAAKLDEAVGATAEAKVTALKRGWDQWTASLVATEGPLGDAAARVSAFAPMAMDAIAAVAPLALALKMGGVADAIRNGPSREVDDLGERADRTSRRTGALKKGLLGLGAGLALGAVAAGIDQLASSADGGEQNVSMLDQALQRALKSAQQILTLDFGGIAKDIGDMLNAEAADFETGQGFNGMIGGWIAELKRELSGFQIEPITIDVKANPKDATLAIQTLLSEVNRSGAEVNINGNTVPAGFALRTALQEIAAGKESIMIDGNPIPAQDALNFIKGVISTTAGDVTINGKTMPAGEALAMLLGEIEQSEGRVMIGADPQQAVGQLTSVQQQINAAMGTVTINGERMPADQSLGAVLAAIDAGAATVTINGQSVPAGNALGVLLQQIDQGAGTVTINGQSVPAGQALAALIQTISAAEGTSTINGNPSAAYQALTAFLSQGNREVTTPQVRADASSATNTLNNLVAQWNGRTIYVNIGGNRVTAGGGLFGYAGGGLAGRPGFAGGGMVRKSNGNGYVIPGHEPGVDRIPVVASPGEAMLVPELVRKIGGRRILAANAAASGGRPATVVGDVAAIMDGTIDRRRPGFHGGGLVAPKPGSTLTVEQAQAGWFQYADGTFDNINNKMWKGAALDAWRKATQLGAVQQATAAAAVGGAVDTLPGGGVGGGSSSPTAVIDAAVKAEITALRADFAKDNTGASTVSTLRALLQAIARDGGRSGDRSRDSRHRSREGCW